MHQDQIYCHHAYLVCNTDGEKAYYVYPAFTHCDIERKLPEKRVQINVVTYT